MTTPTEHGKPYHILTDTGWKRAIRTRDTWNDPNTGAWIANDAALTVPGDILPAFSIKKTTSAGGCSYILPGCLPPFTKKLLQYAAEAYCFILDTGREYTGPEYADEIAKIYSVEEPHNAAVIAALRDA